MKYILPVMLHLLTGKARQQEKIVWSSKSWVHNIFRFYELLFWRRIGIRAELTSIYVSEGGRDLVYYQFHSFEALCAHIETRIREALRRFDVRALIPVRVVWLQPAGVPGAMPMPYLFAIAHDVDATSITSGFAGTVTKTWSHTVTGTNPLIVGLFDAWQDVGGTGTVTAASYNSVAETKIDGIASVSMRSETWYLKAPATGANTQSTTFTGNHDAIKFATSSYTGVDQTAPLDAHNTATGTTGNPTISVTTVAANTVVIATLSRFSTTAATSNRTSIFNDATGSVLAAASYQIVASAAAQSDTYTGTAAQDWSMCIASFAQASGGGGGPTTSNAMFFLAAQA